MSATVDDITINYEEDGVQVVKELDKSILSKGAWTTILFRYQNWVTKTEQYGPERYAIRRYQKRFDQYQLKSKFNISSIDQAKKIIDKLGAWIKDAEENTDTE